MNIGSSPNSHSSFIEQLNSEEQAIFNGLEKISKGSGRIYKKENSSGETTFFRAKSFWSSIYYFFSFKTISIDDIKKINQKTTTFIENSNNSNSKIKVEAVFQKIIQRISNNSSLSFKKGVSLEEICFDPTHRNILLNTLTKFNAREENRSLTGQADEVLSYNEVYLIKQLRKLPDELKNRLVIKDPPLHDMLLKATTKVNDPLSKVNSAMQTLKNTIGPFSVNARTFTEKTLKGTLSPKEIDIIINAKKIRVELQNTVGSYLNLESLRQKERGLNDLFGLSMLQNEQIDEALFDHYYQEHNENFEQAKAKKSILVEGAGPNGLMAALKMYMAGSQVSLINSRGDEYARSQILRLDPKWVSELHYYLGKEFSDMLTQGWALMKPSGYVEIPTNMLEDAIKLRLAHLWSRESLRTGKSVNKKAKHLELQYKIELKGIVQAKDGSFKANLKNAETATTQKFDGLILAGGANDPIRTQYLSPAVPQSTTRDYSVTVRERQIPDLDITKYKDKEDFRGAFKGVFDHFAADFNQALKTADVSKKMLGSDLFNSLRKQAKKIKEQEMDYRFFENPYQLYLGLQYPPELSNFIKSIEEAKHSTKDKDSQNKFDVLLKEIDRQLQSQAFSKLGINIHETVKSDKGEVPAFKEKSSSRFPVNLATTAVQAKILQPKKKQTFISVVGDALASPHFFSGSGLSSGREGVNNLLTSLKNTFNGEPLTTAMEHLNQQQSAIIQFVLNRGKAFTPLLDSQAIQKNSHDLTKKLVEEAKEKNSFPGVKIKKISDDHYVLNKGAKEVYFTISDNGRLLNQGKEFIILSDLIADQL